MQFSPYQTWINKSHRTTVPIVPSSSCPRDHRLNPPFSWQMFGEGSLPCFPATSSFTRGHCFCRPFPPGRFLDALQFVLSPCAGLRKECRSDQGLRKANGKWLLSKLNAAQNINSHFETIIWMKWRPIKPRIMNMKQLLCIYNVGRPEDIRRGRTEAISPCWWRSGHPALTEVELNVFQTESCEVILNLNIIILAGAVRSKAKKAEVI